MERVFLPMTTNLEQFEVMGPLSKKAPAKTVKAKQKALPAPEMGAEAPEAAEPAPKAPQQPLVQIEPPQSIPESQPAPSLASPSQDGVGWKNSSNDSKATGNFENIDFSSFGVEGEGVGVSYGGEAAINPVKAFMSEDDFYQNFEGLFSIGGMATRLESLPIKSHERDAARSTSDLFYEQCCNVTWLNFLVSENGTDAHKYFAVAMFGVGKYKAVSGELAERRRSKNEANQSLPVGGAHE